MDEKMFIQRDMQKITCCIHQRLGAAIYKSIEALGTGPVFVESGRSVRQFVRPRRFKMPGEFSRLEDSPVEIYQFTVDRQNTEAVIRHIIRSANLDLNGHGSIYARDVKEYSRQEHSREIIPENTAEEKGKAALLKDLSLLTFVLSMPGSGEKLSKLALELGTCVPVVSLGIGTGMRDRLGLLRITIPPEKEIVNLLVPAHDAGNILKMLIEHEKLNRPGRGFVYTTPVKMGLPDTRLKIGRQEHAASIEQIIAAIDSLKDGTTWRRRFLDIDSEASLQVRKNNSEIVVYCAEGHESPYIKAAILAGAGGATLSRVRKVGGSDESGGTAARERIMFNTPSLLADTIVEAILQCCNTGTAPVDLIQVTDSPAAFSYRKV